MASSQDSDSDMEFLSDLLDCDVNQIRAVDGTRVQSELDRLRTSLADENRKFKCSKCDAVFSYAKTLNKHLKNNTCSKKSFICENCGKTYKKEAFLRSHTNLGKCVRPRTSGNSSETVKPIKCHQCGIAFSKRNNLKRHLANKSCSSLKVDRIFECGLCGKKFSSAGALKMHLRTHKSTSGSDTSGPSEAESSSVDGHGSDGNGGGGTDGGHDSSNENDNDENDDNDDGENIQHRRLLFQGTLVRYKLKAREAEQQDLMYFFSNRRQQLRKNLLRELRRFRQLKWYVVVKIEMVKYNSDGELVDQGTPVFRSYTKQLLDPHVADNQIDEAYFKMLNSLDVFRAEGSGWNIKKVLYMEQTIAKYSPLGGSCSQYKIPEHLKCKRCLLNVTGPAELDGQCFKYAVLAGLFTGDDATGQLPWSDLHQYRDVLRFDGIPYSGRYMPVTSMGEFEKNNDLSVNVYGYEEDEVFPVHVTKQFKRHKHVNLLLLCPQDRHDSDDDENEIENLQTIADQRRGHYCVIKNMSGLLASQVSQTRARVFICMRCLTTKHSAESLSEHERLCFQEEEEPVRCFMPGYEDKWLKFRNLGKRMKVSFVIVASFACYTMPLLSNDEPTEGLEVRERRLEPCAYSYVRISVDNSWPKDPVYYRGTTPADTMDHFLSAMAAEEEDVFAVTARTAPIVWCDEGFANVEASNDVCFVCQDPFLPKEKVVLDHSHVSGKVRGRCHNSCNLRMKEANFLPVLLQSFSQYESRLILQAVSRFGAESVTVVPQTLDTYVSVSVNRCRYLDFSRFLKAPLNDLVEVLRSKAGLESFQYVKRHMPEETIETVVRKQVYCSDYVDSVERLSEENLPPMAGFYDRISDKHISASDYDHANKVWTLFGMSSLEDFLRNYLLVQSLLFADVLENFREEMMKEYLLDILHYFSLPGFCWDACLFQSGVTLELLTCEEMHAVILDGIRGGCTIVGMPRLAQANNPQMPAGCYDPGKPTSYIQFLDFNLLYPSIMADFPLPTYGFKWLTQNEIDSLNINSISADSDTGYILVCDLECPDDKHDKFDAFPLCPENITVGVDDVSAYTKELAAACNLNLRPSKKLCLTLNPKKHYAVHYLTLQCYLRHGMVLRHIHKVLSFRQSLWLQNFMEFTIEKRRSATNEFDGMLFKSVACHVFGKSIENVKQRINVKIVTSAQKLRRLVNRPSFQAVRVFNSNLAAVQLYREKVKLNKPIAVGFTVLELAKMKMYDFWYDVLLEAFKDFNVSLLMSDTYSFLVHLESASASASNNSVMAILQDYKDKFDLSKLEEGNPLKDDKNRQIPGKMKLQLPNETCMEAVVLSSKCYPILTDRGSLAAMKGVPGRLQHEVYKECILKDTCHIGRVRSIKHFGQPLYHVSTERRMLSPIDMKRYYFSANESLSYGHYRLRDVK